MELEFHPVANIFPLMEGEEFDALVADIKWQGLLEPIVLHPDGSILDGRNRYRACMAAGIHPETDRWRGTGSPVDYVISLNLHRRHLNESQRAMVVTRVATMEKGRPELNAQICAPSQQDAADMMNVSRRLVQSARKVVDNGVQSLIKLVDAGNMPVSAAVKVAGYSGEDQEIVVNKVLAGAKPVQVIRDHEHTERATRFAEGAALNVVLSNTYPVIYADPPWLYEHSISDSRAIENQYPTMPLDDICALPISEIMADDCVLFLWATSPKLEEAMRVLNEWGFSYRTCMIWDKQKIGMGYYARQQHEILLIATKGNPPAPAPENRPPSVISTPRGEHSAKPEEFYGIIERMYPGLPMVELFCRTPRENWANWGNEV